MTIVLQIWNIIFTFLPTHRLLDTIQSIIGVGIGGFVYLTMILRQQFLNESEMVYLPFGQRLLRLMRK